MIIIMLWKKDCYFNCFTVVSDPESDFGHILDQELNVSEVVAGGVEHIMSEVRGGKRG